MNLLITGIAGFIGSKIANAAIATGYHVFGVDDLSQGKIENVPLKAEFIELDLAEKRKFSKLPNNVDFILHLAGQSSGEISFDDPVADLAKNSISTLNLIQYGIERNVQRLLYASSMSVYGHAPDIPVNESQTCQPLSCYGVGKLAAENYLSIYQKSLPFTVFRMFNVYGPGQDMLNLRQGMVSIFLQQAITNKHIQVKGSLARYRDFIYIDDVVYVWLKALENESTKNKIFNLGTGIKTLVEELILKIQANISGVTCTENDTTMGDQFGVYADNTLLKSTFQIEKFTSLDDGLQKFIRSL